MQHKIGRKGLLALGVTMMVVTGVASAAFALSFSDTAGSPFETQIDNITDVGCASGFPDGTFRPTDNANRQQFAYWTNNCGGRFAFTQQTSALTFGGTAQQVALSDSITLGGATGDGQTQLVHLHGVAMVGSDEFTWSDFCEETLICGIEVALYNGGTKLAAQTASWVNADSPAAQVSVSVDAQVQAATGSTLQYSLRVTPVGELDASAGKVEDRSLSATVYPFGPTGGSAP